MKSWILILAGLAAALSVGAEEPGFFAHEYAGYSDTPLIPGTEFRVHQDDRSQPPRVIPGEPRPGTAAAAPSDAIVLFDGTNLEHFQDIAWDVEGDVLTAGKGNLMTKSAFGDCQFHIEWRTPKPPEGRPENMGNSGLFFMGLYELQIYDSYSARIYPDGSAAAIYGQTPPLANASRRPGEWQTYDVIFSAPVWEEDKLVQAARITALHNGVLVHDNTEILGPTAHKASRPYAKHANRLPLMIQGHSSPVSFRNIWIRDLQ